MKLFTIAVLLALAALPLVLLKTQKKIVPLSVDSDDIFDAELRGD